MARAIRMKRRAGAVGCGNRVDRFGCRNRYNSLICDVDRTLTRYCYARVCKGLLAAALITFFPITAVAGAFEDGLAAAKRGEYEDAFGLWRSLAEQGHPAAQLNLGLMYEYGHGVDRSYAKAAKWYHKAAENGLARAQLRLGLMYSNGTGVLKDYALAVRWYRAAAEQGSAKAQSNLGGSYGNGLGVTQDYVLAHMWLSLAAAQGLKAAAKNRDLIAKRMTPAQIDEAAKLAANWRTK